MSVAKPWMASLPAPVTSHSDAGDPGRQFSASISFAGLAQLALAAGAAKSMAQAAATTVAAHAHPRGVRLDAFTIPPYVLTPGRLLQPTAGDGSNLDFRRSRSGQGLNACRRDQPPVRAQSGHLADAGAALLTG